MLTYRDEMGWGRGRWRWIVRGRVKGRGSGGMGMEQSNGQGASRMDDHDQSAREKWQRGLTKNPCTPIMLGHMASSVSKAHRKMGVGGH